MADDDKTGTTDASPPEDGEKPANESLAQTIRGLSELYTSAAKDGSVSPQMTDAVTQALVMVLGSGPSIAALDSLLAAQRASGLLYHNAVANQQKTNLLGMAMTAKCVRYMLDPSAGFDDGILDSELGT
jgi:hypothetical protein